MFPETSAFIIVIKVFSFFSSEGVSETFSADSDFFSARLFLRDFFPPFSEASFSDAFSSESSFEFSDEI
ncbi:MAG: hypothetical protein K2J68_08625 [Treponemataceae bacterium]|nr:hypothetical protein [Treponemataceae bacterium]